MRHDEKGQKQLFRKISKEQFVTALIAHNFYGEK
jgi:hypothetical protein